MSSATSRLIHREYFSIVLSNIMYNVLSNNAFGQWSRCVCVYFIAILYFLVFDMMMIRELRNNRTLNQSPHMVASRYRTHPPLWSPIITLQVSKGPLDLTFLSLYNINVIWMCYSELVVRWSPSIAF